MLHTFRLWQFFPVKRYNADQPFFQHCSHVVAISCQQEKEEEEEEEEKQEEEEEEEEDEEMAIKQAHLADQEWLSGYGLSLHVSEQETREHQHSSALRCDDSR